MRPHWSTDTCFGTETILPWPHDFSWGQHRAPDTWTWSAQWASQESCGYVSSTWWHRKECPRRESVYLKNKQNNNVNFLRQTKVVGMDLGEYQSNLTEFLMKSRKSYFWDGTWQKGSRNAFCCEIVSAKNFFEPPKNSTQCDFFLISAHCGAL